MRVGMVSTLRRGDAKESRVVSIGPFEEISSIICRNARFSEKMKMIKYNSAVVEGCVAGVRKTVLGIVLYLYPTSLAQRSQ